MGFLQSVQQSGAPLGARIVVAGAEKMGKTTFGTGAPKPLLIPTEQGYAGVNVAHTPMMTDWPSFTALFQEIMQAASKGQLPYQSLVIDSATALEKMIHRHTITIDPAYKKNSTLTMESSHGGYGKAYGVADGLYGEFLSWCDWLATNCRINIIVTCHVFSSKVLDPLHGEYDSWDLQLHSPKNQKTFGKREITLQWADVIGYLHEPLLVKAEEGVNRGISRGQGRVLAVERAPSYVAGNRYGMRGLIQLPPPPANSWNAFAHAIYNARGIDVFNREFP